MIKIIVTIVCAFASMLMLIISMATTYWLQWVIPNPAHGSNLTNYQGLLRHCWDVRHNVSDELISEGCKGWFEDAPPDSADNSALQFSAPIFAFCVPKLWAITMIKIVTSFVCSLTAVLMLALTLATDYWQVSWYTNPGGTNATTHNHEGLFQKCVKISDSEGIEKSYSCGVLFPYGKPDYIGAVIAFLILALLCHFVAFVVAMVNGCRKGDPFPVIFVGALFIVAAVFVIIALLVYTFMNWKSEVYFSWSYGGGWSTVALSVIAFVLIMADR